MRTLKHSNRIAINEFQNPLLRLFYTSTNSLFPFFFVGGGKTSTKKNRKKRSGYVRLKSLEVGCIIAVFLHSEAMCVCVCVCSSVFLQFCSSCVQFCDIHMSFIVNYTKLRLLHTNSSACVKVSGAAYIVLFSVPRIYYLCLRWLYGELLGELRSSPLLLWTIISISFHNYSNNNNNDGFSIHALWVLPTYVDPLTDMHIQ